MKEKYKQELGFWSNYASHICEVEKQTQCAKLMGLDLSGHYCDLGGKSVLEVGAGPVALSLRCVNGRRKVIEPLPYPDWVWERYKYFGIETEQRRAEDMQEAGWDEVWVLNVLQHVDDLEKAFVNIKSSASILRIHEWLDIPTDISHPQSLKRESLDEQLGIQGAVTTIVQKYMYQAQAYYGCYDLKTGGKLSLLPNQRFWGGNRDRAMIHYVKEKFGETPLVVAEVGVLAGWNAKFILENLNIAHLYLIDPYRQYDTDTYNQSELDQARHTAHSRLAEYEEKITWLYTKSEDAFKILQSMNVELDVTYCDAEHTYNATYQTAEAFDSITRLVIGGHDYIPDAKNGQVEYGVMSAVQDWTKNKGYNFFCSDFPYSDWWVDKS